MIEADVVEALIVCASEAVENAHAPYSGFRVGAAVLGGSGEIYSGCNVENASYGLSVCAERAAVMRAVCEGEKSILAVAIANSTGKAAFPCGACMQVVSEFAPDADNTMVFLVDDSGAVSYTLAELFPHPFKL